MVRLISAKIVFFWVIAPFLDKSPFYKAFEGIFQAGYLRYVATDTTDAYRRLEVDRKFVAVICNPNRKLSTIGERETIRGADLALEFECSELAYLGHTLHFAADKSKLEISHRILQHHLQTA